MEFGASVWNFRHITLLELRNGEEGMLVNFWKLCGPHGKSDKWGFGLEF